MLITKDENIKTSPIYIGYLILKGLNKNIEGKLSIYEVINKLKSDLGIVHYKQVVYALVFLHMSGVVNFSNPYIYKTND
ncbi:hypothetical protein A2572_03345 [Candidatus Collierbacteria bacterium RIFOXYD1_FULL_40_9]|uniref:Uncharacterized protein n=1 Tax=Candidatus Collierbacteria bacterium RIFOXYD1_FULL_40_9 TaxID=1817731 RepID=A0A1F5FX47_9BACT|nr:MAG: hypothetical protein A2572_03345 [Candidatus Collierbacteria bacterium RIFOXYD1_FULL_40_9]